MNRRERAAAILKTLAGTYPDAHCELDFKTPLELLIATILSAQCTDKRVNIVTRELFRVCRTAADYTALPEGELERLIQSTGFYRAKAKNIRACCAVLVSQHGGEVPRTMEALTALAGVGRKTANVVLGNVFDIHVGVVVDTHVQRLSQRLGLTRQHDAGKNRAGFDGPDPARAVDHFQPLAHLARPQTLQGAQSRLPWLRATDVVPERG